MNLLVHKQTIQNLKIWISKEKESWERGRQWDSEKEKKREKIIFEFHFFIENFVINGKH